ncbi:TolC family outer membrane protein [Wenxinia marina]|uniref:Type I secretion outer membrane protein, TolC family n=1 Tax=Wenxinia marina DSM 24838 TaxID=1123501 RepID=A0A0D0QBH2_9RHOB|nr:TolC family outer membrane protein [Wenxinia marina]KIQ68278.1 type I secretion outer membrane protein, TolC family [Wenxinia marina DSM 24838]GGL79377.1 type I secretion protein TolC [Wenxinia marina]
MLRRLGRQGRRAAAALAVAAVMAAPAAAETIADALAFGYEASGLLEQNRALLRAADEDVAQAVGALLPVVNWSASTQFNAPRTAFQDDVGDQITANLQLTAQITLYDGGANRLAVDAQKELVLATRASLRSVELDILLRIAAAYMEVRRNTEFVTLRQNNLRLITQELRAAEDRFEVGEVTRTDVSLAEARLAAARSLLAAEEGALARAVAEYAAAVGRAPGNLSPAGPVSVPATLDEAQDIAVRTHPAIDEARHNVSAAEINIARAEAAMRPNLTLQGSVSTDLEGNERAGVGLNLSGPIYQGGRLASAVRQIMARRDAARSGLHLSVQGVTQNVANAWTQLEVARASAVALDQQVRAATVAFRSVREEATLGARTTLDVLNAEQELLDARANLVSSQVDETIATYSLLAAMGLLTAEHLGLRVQIYDPAAYYNLVRNAPPALSEQGRALDRVLESIGRN